MEKHLSKFENLTAALSNQEELTSPHVSLLEAEEEVVYSGSETYGSKIKFERDETTGKLYFVVDGVYYSIKEMLFGSVPETSTEYVDLGLSVKWAKCNVGATSPEQYGTYFSWGNIEGATIVGQKQMSEDYVIEQLIIIMLTMQGMEVTTENIAAFKNNPEMMNQINAMIPMVTALITNYSFDPTTYATTSGGQYTGSELDAEHDAATVNMGTIDISGETKTWRMPTIEEITELKNNTTQTVEELNGVNGMRFTSKTNENSIFIPFAGFCNGSLLGNEGLDGLVWSSSVVSDESACNLIVNSDGVHTSSYGGFFSMSVRGVHA